MCTGNPGVSIWPGHDSLGRLEKSAATSAASSGHYSWFGWVARPELSTKNHPRAAAAQGHLANPLAAQQGVETVAQPTAVGVQPQQRVAKPVSEGEGRMPAAGLVPLEVAAVHRSQRAVAAAQPLPHELGDRRVGPSVGNHHPSVAWARSAWHQNHSSQRLWIAAAVDQDGHHGFGRGGSAPAPGTRSPQAGQPTAVAFSGVGAAEAQAVGDADRQALL
jgi:hypothetical protein